MYVYVKVLNGGVAACSSQDLITWRFEGIVFHYTNLSDQVYGSGQICYADINIRIYVVYVYVCNVCMYVMYNILLHACRWTILCGASEGAVQQRNEELCHVGGKLAILVYIHTYSTYIHTYIQFIHTLLDLCIITGHGQYEPNLGNECYRYFHLRGWVRICIHTCIHAYIHTLIYTYIPTYVRTLTIISFFQSISISPVLLSGRKSNERSGNRNTCIHSYSTYIYTYIHTYTHTYIYRHTNID